MKKKKNFVKKILKPQPNIAIIRLHGIIAASTKGNTLSLASLEAALEKAFSLPRLKAVALDINSPGGSPVESSKIYRRIRSLSEQTDVPVYSFASDVAASGGYWLACAGDEIYAEHSSIVGSIGVISASFGFQELIKKYGIQRRVYTAGKSKSILDPFVEEKEDDIRHLRNVQDDIHHHFKELVRMARGSKIQDEENTFTGAFFTGSQAVPLGLIDGVSELKIKMYEKFGEEISFRVVNPVPKQKRWWMGRLRGMAAEDIIGEAISQIEQKSIWSRFGL